MGEAKRKRELGITPESLELEKRKAAWQGKLNIYTCEVCRGHIVTRDLDAGVTPFMIGCEVDSCCPGFMKSSMYRVFDERMRESHQWRKPQNVDELAALSRHEAEHVANGGLILYPALETPARPPNAIVELLRAVEPFARAFDAADKLDPAFPESGAVLRASYDFAAAVDGVDIELPQEEYLAQVRKQAITRADLRRLTEAFRAVQGLRA